MPIAKKRIEDLENKVRARIPSLNDGQRPGDLCRACIEVENELLRESKEFRDFVVELADRTHIDRNGVPTLSDTPGPSWSPYRDMSNQELTEKIGPFRERIWTRLVEQGFDEAQVTAYVYPLKKTN